MNDYTTYESALVKAAQDMADAHGVAAGVIPLPGDASRFVAFGELSQLRDLVRDAAPRAQQAAGSIDTGELRRLAEAATPGPWDTQRLTDDECSFIGYSIHGADGKAISDDGTAPNSKDAAYIAAANPAAILRLLDRAVVLEARHERDREQLVRAAEICDAARAAAPVSGPTDA